VPGLAKMIQNVILNLIQFDILYTEYWMPLLFEQLDLNSEKNKEPLNSFFYENGYEETFLLGNLGSTLVYIVLFVFMLLIQLILRLCGSY
jgi:hypothetical protein